MKHLITPPYCCICIGIGVLLSIQPVGLLAQNSKPNTQKTSDVKRAKTDNTFANTTEIHKKESASDEQILTEITNEYGLGDVVRITIAPPPPPPAPIISNKAEIKGEKVQDKPKLSLSFEKNATDKFEDASIGKTKTEAIPENKNTEKMPSTEGGDKAYNFNLNESFKETEYSNFPVSKPDMIPQSPQKTVLKTKITESNKQSKASYSTRKVHKNIPTLRVKPSKSPFSWLFPKKKYSKKSKKINTKGGKKYGCYKF